MSVDVEAKCPKCEPRVEVPHTLVAINLIRNREDYRTLVLQRDECGHHHYVGIAQGVVIQIGEQV